MDNTKVSVIIPVYGAEAYIERCARSLFGQTLEEAEFIFVDDCTPDRSIVVLKRVVEEFPQRKSQVKIIHNDVNRGVSMSRQDGLDAATGEYVIHADPDDWVEPEMLEQLYQTAIADEADMIICDFYHIDPKTGQKRYVSQRPEALDAESVQRQLFRNLHGCVWNKLVRRAVIRKANVRFPEDYSFCEDLTFNTELLNQSLKIVYLPKAFYNYVWSATGSSLSSAYSERIEREEKLMHARILELLTERPETSEIARRHLYTMAAQRAFLAGTLSSADFKNKFIPVRRYIYGADNGRLMAMCLRMALSGYAWPALKIYNFISKIRP